MVSSSKLVLEPDEVKKAQAIIDKAVEDIEAGKVDDWDYCDCDAVLEDDGVWFHADESINVGHMEYIARQLIEELEINEPFYASWSFQCSKPRIDEFGGGAFVIQRGFETLYVDAMGAVHDAVKRGKLKPLKKTDGKET